MFKPTMPSDVIVGQYLQFICLVIGAAIAFVMTCGYVLGELVHKVNYHLAVFHTKSNPVKFTILLETLTNALQL